MLYADRVIEYSEFKQINILKKEGKMDGQLKVAAVQVTVEQNNIKNRKRTLNKVFTSAVQGTRGNIHENLKKNTKNYSRRNIRT